ncbi:MAG: PAS domain S-box protein [Fibrobacterales bacterium]
MIALLLLIAGVSVSNANFRVLYVSAYHPGFSTFDDQVQGIKEGLGDLNVSLDVEFMDTKRLPYTANTDLFREYLGYKLSVVSPYDLIIVGDDNALTFALTEIDGLFAYKPIVFLGVNNVTQARKMDGQPRITGVIEAVSIQGTIEVMQRMIPEADTIVALVDNMPSGQGDLVTYYNQAAAFKDVTFTDINLSDYTWSDYQEILKNDTQGKMYLLLSAYKDSTGMSVQFDEGVKRITQSLNAPLFHLWKHGIGSGLIGGKVVDHYYQGKSAGSIAASILEGKDVNTIPVSVESPNAYWFDYTILSKYSIAINSVPSGAIIINKPSTFYTQNKGLIKTVIGVIGFLFLSLIIALVNIKKRKSVEEKLRESDQKHQSLIAGIADVIVVINTDNIIIYQSPNVERLLGWTSEDVSGTDANIYIHKDDAERLAPYFEKIIHNPNKIFQAEFRLICKDGSEKYVASNAINMLADPLIGGILFSYHDITDKRQADEERLALQHYFSSVINVMPSWIIGLTAEGIITHWNAIVADASGLSSEAAVGNNLFELIPEFNIIYKNVTTSLAIDESQTMYNIDLGYSAAPVHCDLTIYPVTIREGNEVVLRIDDVSEKHHLEDQLRHTVKMDAIGQLSGGVAHDFNNMLGGIIGAAQLLKKPKFNLTTDAMKYVDLLLSAANRAADLTAKLLAFGRTGPLVKESISVDALIEDTLVMINASLLDKNINVQYKRIFKYCTITGEDSALQNALLNLSLNGIQAMKDGGALTITLSNILLNSSNNKVNGIALVPGDYVCISVSDTGMGIDTKDFTRIFEPFFTTKGKGEGTGLGLAAVYGTVLDHGGAIDVQSSIGVGTTFSIYIPLMKDAVQESHAIENVAAGSGLILVADDEEVLRVTITDMLEDLEYSVITATNGQEAVELFEKHQNDISVVLLDMIMPIMKGSEAFYAIKNIKSSAKIIIASGYTDSEIMEDLLDAGLYAFISKPFKRNELVELLQNAHK